MLLADFEKSPCNTTTFFYSLKTAFSYILHALLLARQTPSISRMNANPDFESVSCSRIKHLRYHMHKFFGKLTFHQ